MEYFKIGSTDYSSFVSGITATRKANYNAETNASGNTVVDYINNKYELEVEFIPMSDSQCKALLLAIGNLQCRITFLEPLKNASKTINCIVKSTKPEYYTIQTDKVILNKMKITFIEL